MAIPTVLTDLSATLASNPPAGGDAAFPNIDDYLRAAYGFIRQGDTKASDVASAAAINLGAAVGRIVDVTGVVTITSFGTVAAGIWRIVRFTGALTLTHNGTSLILPGAANITTAAGDCLLAISLGSGNWLVPFFQNASVVPHEVVSGIYTPTITVTANIAAPSGYSSAYTRVGSVVTVTGRFAAVVTTANTLTTGRISLPVASNFAAVADANGLVNIYGSPGGVAYADVATDTIAFSCYPAANGAISFYWTAQYSIL